MRNYKLPAFALSMAALAVAVPAHAEITILDKNSQSNALLAPLSVQFGGSIRPEWTLTNGKDPDPYGRRGHDGGSRIRFHADYSLTQHTSLLGYYELGFDVPKVLGMKGNYDPSTDRDYQRQLYAGIKDDRYGTLTYGHQFGLYYSVVGERVICGITMVTQARRASDLMVHMMVRISQKIASCIKILSIK